MARTWALILAAALPMAAAPAAPTATAPGEKKADAKDPDRDKPEAKKPPEKTEEADKGVPKALVAAAGESFVKVHYHFKKDVTEEASRQSWAAWRARAYERHVDDKITLDAVGVVIAPRQVLVCDNGLEERFIDRIEVVAASGKRYAGRRDRLLERAPVETLKVEGKLTPLKFADPGPVTLETSLWAAGLVREGKRWHLTYSGLSPSMRFDPKARDNVLFAAPGEGLGADRYGVTDTSARNALQIVADSKGRPVGVCSDAYIDARQELCLWKGKDLIAAKGIPRGKILADKNRLRAKLLKSVHEVKIKFRQGSRERDDFGTGVEGREISAYCMAISKRRALVPQFFSRKIVAKIDRIDIKYALNRRARCRFVGVYKDFGATLIELTQSDFPGFVRLAPADPPRMQPLWAVSAREKAGKTDVDVTVNRLLEKQRGYRNHFHWIPARSVPRGTFLLTRGGELAGIQLRQRVEDEEQHQLAKQDRYGRRSSGSRRRLFTIGELRGPLTKPGPALDDKIKVLPKALAKRRHWFGVEYVGMNKDLAEQMKVQKPTKDGTIGFLVSAVYAGSPADQMGVAIGDILLSLRVHGQPYPVELKSRLAGRERSTSYYDSGDDRGPPPRTWKNRGNWLTRVLDAIGEGKTVQVTYYDADSPAPQPGAKAPAKQVTKKFAIRRAPPDFDSAAKWKNRKIGLTVKDLTYEIRLALTLAAGAPGVVVSRIEPGSPANVARIWVNEIITRADDKPVPSARRLREMIAAARKAGKDKVRLTILRLGKTRFADLTIKAYDPADDEGLEED